VLICFRFIFFDSGAFAFLLVPLSLLFNLGHRIWKADEKVFVKLEKVVAPQQTTLHFSLFHPTCRK
jgi:hypothetical protein